MKTKHIVGVIPAFALLVFWFANAYATFDSHVHTGNGPIDSWPNITVTGTHKIRVCAPTIGTISAYTWISGPEFEDQVDASNGNSATSSGHTLSSGANVLFDSWVSGYGSGTGKAYLADIGTTLPNCSAQ